MELIIANGAGKTVERYRVVYCSQELDNVVDVVSFPDGYCIPISRNPGDCKIPLTAAILAANIETAEMKCFNVSHYKLIN